jgi:hypothetical protein
MKLTTRWLQTLEDVAARMIPSPAGGCTVGFRGVLDTLERKLRGPPKGGLREAVSADQPRYLGVMVTLLPSIHCLYSSV